MNCRACAAASPCIRPRRLLVKSPSFQDGVESSILSGATMKICKQCQKEIVRPAKRGDFCSRSCSAPFNNLAGIMGKARVAIRFCLNCNGKLTSKHTTYCSVKCRQTYQLQKWLKGKNFSLKWGGTPVCIKQFLLKEAGYKCSQCGWGEINPVTGNCPVEVDHIDGDNSNNLRENLRILCPNCHSLTPTFRNLNTVGGRKRGKRI